MKWTNQHVVTESSGHHITDETSVDETYMDTTIMHQKIYMRNKKISMQNKKYLCKIKKYEFPKEMKIPLEDY